MSTEYVIFSLLFPLLMGFGTAALVTWLRRCREVARKMHNGQCDRPGCTEYGMIFLNGREIICWNHYREICANARKAGAFALKTGTDRMSLTLRRFTDVDLIAALNSRGYVVRKAIDSRRQLVVERTGDPTNEWKAAALEAIRGNITMDDLTFESVNTAADVTLHRAALRVM